MKRKFSTLEPFEAMHVAIFIEERNARIYQNFAQMFVEFNDAESHEIAASFQEMASEERHHGTQLQELYLKNFGNRPCALTDTDIADVIEVPQLQDGEQFIYGGSNARQALEVALAAERQARTYYTELAALTMEAPLRGFYQELASLERDHEEFLERKLATLQPRR